MIFFFAYRPGTIQNIFISLQVDQIYVQRYARQTGTAAT